MLPEGYGVLKRDQLEKNFVIKSYFKDLKKKKIYHKARVNWTFNYTGT